MSRTTGKRLDVKAMELFEAKKTVTPAELNDHLGIGDYASKQVCLLKRMGYNITTNKDGRKVASYTYSGKGAVIYANSAEALKAKRGQKAKTMAEVEHDRKVAAENKVAAAKKEKAAKKAAKTEKKVKPKFVINPSKKVTQVAAASKPGKTRPVRDAVEKTFGTSGVVAGHSVDPDWDSMDGIDVANFLK